MRNTQSLAKKIGLVAVSAFFLAYGAWYFINRGQPYSELILISNITWTHPGDERFGGFSGLEIGADGAMLIALSDHPALYFASIERDGELKITSIDVTSWDRLTSDIGNYIDLLNGDTEGLALTAGHGLFLSLEGFHSLNYVFPGSHVVNWIDLPPEMMKMPPNRGIEALAQDEIGRPLLIREGFENQGDAPIYRFEGDHWTIPYRLGHAGSFLPVGADLGPDGRLYILERDYVPLIGFKSQIRSFALGETQLEDEKLLFRSGLRDYDNLEGLSVWQTPAGRIRLTAISDDNFNWFQTTQVVEFELPQ